MNLKLDNGKYEIIQKEGSIKILRYNEEWRDETGDNVIYFLLSEIKELKEKINNAKGCLVCAAIEDPAEVCINTLEILEHEH